jgi:hypothetical protein
MSARLMRTLPPTNSPASYNEVVIAPFDLVQRRAEGFPALALKVRVTQHVIAEAVVGQRVGGQLAVVGEPVVRELLGAEHQHVAVAQLVVLDDGKRGEGLAETHAVGKDAAIEGFELIDDAHRGIALKLIQRLPDDGVLPAGAVFGQHVFAEIRQELIEDVVQHQEIDAFLLVHRCNMLDEARGDIFHLVRRIPDLLKQRVELRRRRLGHAHGHAGDGVAALIAEVHRGEALKRLVDNKALGGVHAGKLLHRRAGGVGAECGFALDPFRAVAGDGTLGQPVLEPDLELAAVEGTLPLGFRNVKLAPLAPHSVGDLVRYEGRGGEDELERIDLLQLGPQGLVSEDREIGRGNAQSRPGRQGALEVVAQTLVDIVDKQHAESRGSCAC